MKALTYIYLPVIDVRKAPGDEITDDEWEAAGQTQEDKENMIDAGSLSDDADAPLHPDHVPVPPGGASIASMVENAQELVDRLGKDAPKELKALAKLDVQDVISGDSGEGASNAGS